MNHSVFIIKYYISLLIGIGFIVFSLASCSTSQLAQSAKINTSSKEEYLLKRSQLISEDKSLSFSANVMLNADEAQLDKKLSALQKLHLETYKDQHFFPPARDFYQSKKHIEAHPIYRILQKMPKGGALHIHTMAMGDADWIINRAIEEPLMHIYWGEESDQYIKGQFKAFKENEAVDGFYSADKLLTNNNEAQAELRSLITFDEGIDRDSVDIWLRFDKVFQRIIGFVRFEPIFSDYIAHGFELMIQDNVQHVELRMSFADQLYHPNEPNKTASIKSFVKHMNQAYNHAKLLDPDFTLRIIHANLRFRNNETIWSDMKKVLEYRKSHSDLLAGYDLVAEEDAGHTTLFHIDSFLKLDSTARSQNMSMPLYLHDGESVWAHSDNLYDAILLGSKRIGHGFNLFRFPSLMKRALDNDICIEINPLSNQILGYIRDLRMHPAHEYIDRGINCTISSDDPLIFDYHGLSYDYWSIYMAWELSLADLKKLSQNGILYSALPPQEKVKALQAWENRWNTFVKSALAEIE